MTPELIAAAVAAAVQLIGFLTELKRNGQLTDEQLDAIIGSENADTREMIRKALAE